MNNMNERSELKKLAQRSIDESWSLFIDVLKDNLNEEEYRLLIKRLDKPPRIVWKELKNNFVAGFYIFPTVKHPKKNYSHVPQWDDFIEMNEKYLNSSDAIKFVWETSKHELGHCLNYRLNFRTGHDAAFRAIVKAIGGNPSTTHNYESDFAYNEKYKKFICECGETIFLTKVKISKAKAGKYICSKCRKNLKYLKQLEN